MIGIHLSGKDQLVLVHGGSGGVGSFGNLSLRSIT